MTRTDHDSWDLASSVGATATAVAASRALASQGPDPLIDDPFAEPLVRAVGVAPRSASVVVLKSMTCGWSTSYTTVPAGHFSR